MAIFEISADGFKKIERHRSARWVSESAPTCSDSCVPMSR